MLSLIFDEVFMTLLWVIEICLFFLLWNQIFEIFLKPLIVSSYIFVLFFYFLADFFRIQKDSIFIIFRFFYSKSSLKILYPLECFFVILFFYRLKQVVFESIFLKDKVLVLEDRYDFVVMNEKPFQLKCYWVYFCFMTNFQTASMNLW